LNGALALALGLAAGAALASALLGGFARGRGERVAWVAALAPLFGAGAASLLLVGHRALGFGAPGRLVFVAEVGLAIWALARWRRRRGSDVAAAEPLLEEPPSRWPRRLAGLALALAAVLALRAAFGFAREVPLGAWDAVATWNLRARLLFGAGADWVAALDATNYPLLLPGAIAAGWALAGAASPAVPWGLGLGFTAAAAALAALAVAPRASAAGWGAAALLLATPTFLVQGFSQEADVPVAALLLAAVVPLARRLDGGEAPPPAVAGAALGLLVWTKNEGALWGLLVVAAYLIAGRRRALRDFGALAAAAAPGVLALVLFKLLAAPERGLGAESFLTGEWRARLADPDRWRDVVAALSTRFDPTRPDFAWGLGWLVVTAALLLAALPAAQRERGGHRFRALVVAGILAALVPLYALTPLPLGWHLATSLDRLLLQLYPTALAAAAAVWAGVAGRDSTRI
jgi:hypothetical protein